MLIDQVGIATFRTRRCLYEKALVHPNTAMPLYVGEYETSSQGAPPHELFLTVQRKLS